VAKEKVGVVERDSTAVAAAEGSAVVEAEGSAVEGSAVERREEDLAVP